MLDEMDIKILRILQEDCTPEKLAAALRDVDIFKGLNDRQIARLAKRATRRDFPAGTHFKSVTGIVTWFTARRNPSSPTCDS